MDSNHAALFVFAEKICSHHFPLGWLCLEGGWKKNFFFQFYSFWHSEDMGRLASSRIEASSDSLFFILLGMFKTWDRRFFPFKIAKYLYKSFTIELLWVNQHHGQRRTAFRSSHLCILQKYLKISFRCLIKLDAAVAVGSDEAFLHIP